MNKTNGFFSFSTVGFLGLTMMLVSLVVHAGIPEPGIMLYGKVTNTSGVVLTSGQLTWTYSPVAGGTPISVTIQLSSITGTGGPYSYVAQIPLETVIANGAPASTDAIAITATPVSYNRLAKLGANNATITSSTYAGSMNISTASKGLIERVDLEVQGSAIGQITATRTLPANYTPGISLNVTISVVPVDTTDPFSIKETPPAGWTISGISHGGTYNAASGTINWGPYYDQDSRNLTYTATPLVSERGAKSFSGLCSLGGQDSVIGGSTSVTQNPGVDPNPPAIPSVPMPANLATTISVTTLLDWADSLRATSYDVYLWKTTDTKPASPTAANITTSIFDPPGNLEYSQTYNWQVVAKNLYGTSPGSVWRFTTKVALPAVPSVPKPDDGTTSTSVYSLKKLDWSDCARATSYKLYLWKGGSSMPAQPTASNLTQSEYTLPTRLAESATYHWKVLSVNSTGETMGAEWVFTTGKSGVKEWGLYR